MSEPNEKVDISELKDAFLECPVCVEHFNQTDRRPRLLQTCLHAFCTQCLHQLLHKEGKKQITCPICRQVQKVVGNVELLPRDPVREQLTDYLQIKHNKIVVCEDCPDKNRAASRCTECGENLCQECENAHKRNRSTRGHRVVPFEDLEHEYCKGMSVKHFCVTHPDRVIECFCTNCENLCCLLCVVIDHKGHDFMKLEDAARIKIKDIDTLMVTVDKLAVEYRTAKSQSEAYIKEIIDDKQKSLLEIKSHFEAQEKLLKKRQAHLIRELEERSAKLLAVAKKTSGLYDDTLAEIQSTQTYFSNAKSKTDEVSILQTYPSVKTTLCHITSNRCDNIQKFSQNIVFEAVGEEDVRKLIASYGTIKDVKKDGEWSSNTSHRGRITYGRDFLLVLQHSPYSMKKPDSLLLVPEMNPSADYNIQQGRQRYVMDPRAEVFQHSAPLRTDILRPPRAAALQLPDTWEPMTDKDVQLKAVNNTSKEFEQVQKKFTEALGTTPGQILRLDRIQSKTLYQQYHAKKRQLEKQNPGVTVERSLWHGTNTSATMSISTYGFNRSYCDKEQNAFGEGAYFTTDAGYAARDRYAPADAQGKRYMFMCKVLTGSFAQGKPKIRVPPPKDPNNPLFLYDSVVDDPNNPKTFVIFSDLQAYPEYLISFQ